MGKRIFLVPQPAAVKTPPQKGADRPWEPGQDRRQSPRRSGLPRRMESDRRRRETANLHAVSSSQSQRRSGVRRQVADRRRRRDRRFGLDPTLYDRLVDLDL